MLRWTLLLLAFAVPCAAAAPAAIPAPDYLGVYVERADGSLSEIPPVDETMRDLFTATQQGQFPPGFIERLESAVLAPESPVVIYEPGVRVQDFIFLRLSPGGDTTETLHPRIRPSRDVEGLWEITWREPLNPGVLLVALESDSTHTAHLAQITSTGQPEAWPAPPALIPMPASRESQTSAHSASEEQTQ